MCRDVRMVERREDFGFALEPRKPIGIGAKVAGRTLIATSRFELRVARAIDLAHAARAEGGEDLVRAEASRRRERHTESDYRSRTPARPAKIPAQRRVGCGVVAQCLLSELGAQCHSECRPARQSKRAKMSLLMNE